jgi:hypothetical protein
VPSSRRRKAQRGGRRGLTTGERLCRKCVFSVSPRRTFERGLPPPGFLYPRFGVRDGADARRRKTCCRELHKAHASTVPCSDTLSLRHRRILEPLIRNVGGPLLLSVFCIGGRLYIHAGKIIKGSSCPSRGMVAAPPPSLKFLVGAWSHGKLLLCGHVLGGEDFLIDLACWQSRSLRASLRS